MQIYSENTLNTLGRNRNTLLLGLFALATFVVFDIGTISLSFLLGALLILGSLEHYRFFFRPRGLSWFLLVFVLIIFISLLFTAVPTNTTTLKRVAQLLYWLLLAFFVFNSYEFVDKKLLSKIILISCFSFLLLDVIFLEVSQNKVAFTVIIMGPMGLFFLRKYYLRILYGTALLILILLNGSRTGAILCFLQLVIFLIIFTPHIRRFAKGSISVILILVLSMNIAPVRIALGKAIVGINKELGDLLINPENVFRNDTSWLQRRAQINKGLQIFEEHPLLGIGVFNFYQYDIDIDVSNIERDRKVIKNINNRSAHNAYIDLLSETGILGISTIVLMFAFALWPFIKELNEIGGTFEGCVFISTIGMLGYFYFISGFYGTSAWIMYGLILGASASLKSNNTTL